MVDLLTTTAVWWTIAGACCATGVALLVSAWGALVYLAALAEGE